MRQNTDLNMLSWRYAKDALAFPIIVCASGMSLVTIYACIVMRFGLHQQPEHFLPLVVGIAGAVAGPMTIFAFFREHHRYVAHLALKGFATTDPLTGLLNRRAFQDAVTDEQLRMVRSGKSAALVLFDVDHFKHLNDTHGHSVGDEVLKAISALAHSELRGPFDRLGRWGGEEFIILLNDVSHERTLEITERLRQSIEARVLDIAGVTLNVTASFGFAGIEGSSSFEAVISRADEAMYTAKANGRNRVVGSPLIDLAA